MGGSLQESRKSLRKRVEEGLLDAKKRANYQRGDKVRIVSLNENFKYPISTVIYTNVTIEKLLEQIENIVTSDRNVDINKTTFDIQIIKVPR